MKIYPGVTLREYSVDIWYWHQFMIKISHSFSISIPAKLKKKKNMDGLASLVHSVWLFKQTEVVTVQENPLQSRHLFITNQVAGFAVWRSFFFNCQSIQLKVVSARFSRVSSNWLSASWEIVEISSNLYMYIKKYF